MKYFLHDTSAFNDEKITELYIKFGYEGLGLFYTILEKIAQQEKPVKTLVLKSQLNVGKKLEKCWAFLEEIELISSNNGETFNEQLLNFSKKYQIKKEKNTERIKQWRKNQEDTKNVTRYESVSNTPKVNKSKVKESKGIIDVSNSTLEYSQCTEFWLKEFHEGWTFGGQQGKAMKSIIKKIKALNTTEAPVNVFKIICLKIPEWFKDKDLPVIDSKFNEIIEQIKNNSNGITTNKSKPVSKYHN